MDTERLASLKRGYDRELVAGPIVRDLAPGLSRTSSSSYAFVTHPIRVGQTGVRSFCGDHTGRVCFGAGTGLDLVERTASEVRCSRACKSLE